MQPVPAAAVHLTVVLRSVKKEETVEWDIGAADDAAEQAQAQTQAVYTGKGECDGGEVAPTMRRHRRRQYIATGQWRPGVCVFLRRQCFI